MTEPRKQDHLSFTSRMARWFTPILSTLIVLYGVTTAFSAFKQSQVDDLENDAQIVGLLELTRSNDAFDVADRKAGTDFDALTRIIILEATGGDPLVIEILEDTLTEEALAALRRSNTLDDAYFDEIYALANALYDNAFMAFSAAGTLGNLRTNYDITLLLLAVGLGFAGWSSLLGDDSRIGFVFGLASTILFVVTVIILAGALGLDMPAEIIPLPEI